MSIRNKEFQRACQASQTISTSRRVLSFSFFPLHSNALNEIHTILTETLGVYALSYTTIKSWVAQFKHGDFSTCDVLHLG
jgi:hypothetical protein